MPTTHKFEAVAQNLAAEHGVPISTATVMARKQFPRLYQSYQQSGLQDNAARSHQALVTAEIDKGFSEVVAKQRVMHAYGEAPRDLMKGDTAVTKFMRVTDRIMQKRGVERTEAMRLARKRNPGCSLSSVKCERFAAGVHSPP